MYIEELSHQLGLLLNAAKSELIANNHSGVEDMLSMFPGLQYICPDQVTHLGSCLGVSAVMDICFRFSSGYDSIDRRTHGSF